MPKQKKKSKSKPVEEEEEEEQFQVEVVLAARVTELQNKMGWWADYEDDSNTWEPQNNLKTCERLLHSFWKHVGFDNKDYNPGHTIYAKESWIKKEKRYFARENDPTQNELRQKREKEEKELLRKFREVQGSSADARSIESADSSQTRSKRPTTTIKIPKKFSSQKKVVQDSESDSDKDTGLYPKRLKRKRTKSVVPIDEDDDDDDDAPLTSTHAPPQKTQKLDGGRKVSTEVNNALKEKKDKEKSVHDLFSESEEETSPELPLKSLPSDQRKASATKQKTTESGLQKTGSAASPQIPSSSKPPLPQRRPTAPTGNNAGGASSATPAVPSQTTPNISSQPDTPAIPSQQTPTIPSGGAPQLPKRSLLTNISGVTPGPSTPASSPQVASNPAGIAAKSKVTHEALQLVRPNAAQQQPKKSIRPSLSVKTGSSTNSVIPTGFKKKTEYPPTRPSAEFQRTPITPIAGPVTATAEPILSPNAMVESPVNLDVMLGPPADNDDNMIVDNLDMTPGWSPVAPKTPAQPDAADQFLRSIMPEGLAAPLEPAMEEQRDILPPGLLMSRKSSIPLAKIPKKWTWSGKVFTESSPSNPIFTIKFDDVTAPVPSGLRFNVVLADQDSIFLPSFHDINDIFHILRACKKPQQCASWVPSSEEDKEPVRVFSKYLMKFKKFVAVPTYLDGHCVAVMLIVPCVGDLCRKMRIASSVVGSNPPLVVALFPWLASTSHLAHRWRRDPSVILPSNVSIEAQTLYPNEWEQLLRKDPALQRAFRILKPSNHFLKYVGDHQRTYYIWHGNADGTSKRAGLETNLLRTILDNCCAMSVEDPSGARLVFIHVGALSRLHLFPNFALICSTKPSIQFHTFGTHTSVVPERWGIREIYACGGIVTFTPGAIMNDYFDVLERIRQIHSHPLWLCYVLPSVLGCVAMRYGDNPLEQYDMDIAPYKQLLVAIADGEISLLNSPPTGHSPTEQRGDPRTDWIATHWVDRPEDPRSILEFCVSAFNQKYGHMERSKAQSAILDEISLDLSYTRQQPVIMDRYRRYTVLKNEQEQRPKSSNDGNEWTSVVNFDFKDDFFPKNRKRTQQTEQTSAER